MARTRVSGCPHLRHHESVNEVTGMLLLPNESVSAAMGRFRRNVQRHIRCHRHDNEPKPAVHPHSGPPSPAGHSKVGHMAKPLRFGRMGRMGRASCGIAVMAKASIPGRTKTRLVPPLSFEEAAAFNTAFLQDVAANILIADREARRWGGRLSGYMAFGPPRSEPFFREILPVSVGLIEAWHPNFGDCLFAAVKKLLVLGHSGAAVVNSDSPTLPTALLVEAAEVLARSGDHAVLGPSTDGGYYLLGLKKPHRRLFED